LIQGESGTLFLDEIGGKKPLKFDVRVISATNVLRVPLFLRSAYSQHTL
jgi:transcriptional regulator with PAS, ATPase and Fis domain